MVNGPKQLIAPPLQSASPITPPQAKDLQTLKKSGFPLQLKIEDIVRKNPRLGWVVRHSEHAWRSNVGRGFIDIVLERGDETSLVIECKKVQETTWIFLVPTEEPNDSRAVKAFVDARDVNTAATTYFDWHEVDLRQNLPVSEFCIVSGGDDKAPMLERLAGETIAATEALANEHYGIWQHGYTRYPRTYFTIIVTTAKLKIGRFSAANVSLVTGEVDSAEFEEVSYLRFHKQLSTAPVSGENITGRSVETVEHLSRAKATTVIVVNAERFEEFLGNFDWIPSTLYHLLG